MSKPTMKVCEACGKEIAANAKSCPACGAKNKKPIYKRVWFILLIAVAVIIVLAVAFGGGDDTASNGDQKGGGEAEEQKITYEAYSVDTLMKDLESNAASASDKYKGKHVELEGELSNIDSDTAYIEIISASDEWAIIGVTCYPTNDEQKEKIKTLQTGDVVTVKGKITDVGEILGYDLDIDSIK